VWTQQHIRKAQNLELRLAMLDEALLIRIFKMQLMREKNDLQQNVYIFKPDFSYSGLQFNLDYLVSDYIEESNGNS
jgi:hypothetical protein